VPLTKKLNALQILRVKTYRYLSDALLRGFSGVALRQFKSDVLENDAFLAVYGAEVGGALSSPVSDGETALRREYARLLEGCGDCVLPVWESAYTGAGNVLCDRTTLAVKQAYRRFGFAVRRELCQLDDHLGIELEFVALLNADLRTAEQKDFISAHILPFLTPFCANLTENAETEYYKNFAQFLERFIRCERALPGQLIETPSAARENTRRIAAFTPYALRPMTDAESAEASPLRVVPTAGCNNCGGKCVIYAHVRDGGVLKVSTAPPSKDDSRETLTCCARGNGYRKSFLSANRLRYPMRRVGERGGGRFERISWEEAVDAVANKIREIGGKYGPASRYVNYASGVAAAARGNLFAQRLLALDGGFLDAYNSYSSACADIATPYTYGTSITGSTSDTFSDSKLILLWGHNPLESGFGNSTQEDLLRAASKGVKIIVIDPRYSDTAAAYADEWIPIRPTTDSALADAMAYVMITENLHDRAFLDKFCIGFDPAHMPAGAEREESYLEYVTGVRDGIPKTPQYTQGVTGIPAETIVRIAREYATQKPAALIPGLGPQRHGNGEQTVRSCTLLACLTGNVGIRGGSAAGCGFVMQRPLSMEGAIPNPAAVSIPSFLWTEAIIRGAEMTARDDGVRGAERLSSPIKLILNLAGNTLVNQHSDINRTMEILRDTSKCEFIVCSDLFMTPSAKFADILLPGTSMFENDNISAPWRQGDYLLYCNQAIEPLFESRFEFGWLREVGQRLGVDAALTGGCGTLREWLRAAYSRMRASDPALPDWDAFTRQGGHQYGERTTFIAFERQIADPQSNVFPTPSGKIELFSERLHDLGNPADIPAIPKYVPSFEGPADVRIQKFPLQLIGWHTKVRSHSVHDHNDWKLAVERQEAWLNPIDAAARGIEDGDLAEIWNDRGKMRIPIHVTNRIMPGVAAVSQGAWFRPDGDGTDTGGSINILTTSRPTPLAKGNPQHSNLVEIRRVSRAAAT
jgi:anaerobic dimethyl sulfoxide reductase subunit A